MPNETTSIDPVVIESVRASLSQAEQDFAIAERDLEAKTLAVKQAEAVRDAFANKRDRLTAFLIGTVGVAEAAPPPASDAQTGAARVQLMPKKAAELASALLSDGRSMKSEAIYIEFQRMGYFISNDNPARRLGQMLSTSGLFESGRITGWSLKKHAS